jgi:hypothetical protein
MVMRGFGGQAAVVAGMVIAGLLVSDAGRGSSPAMLHAVLHAAGAVVLVALAVALTWTAVHAVSDHKVIRAYPHDEPELLHYETGPPLLRYRPEPGEDGTWTALPAYGSAPAVALPGRGTGRSDQPEVPEPEDAPR